SAHFARVRISRLQRVGIPVSSAASQSRHATVVARIEEGMSANDFTDDDLDELAPEGDRKPRKSQGDRVVELAQKVEFFHADVDEPFGSVQVGEHVETWAVQSKGFRRWLSREFWNRHKKAPSSQAVQDALSVLTGRAIHDGKRIPVHIRVAGLDEKLYLDL